MGTCGSQQANEQTEETKPIQEEQTVQSARDLLHQLRDDMYCFVRIVDMKTYSSKYYYMTIDHVDEAAATIKNNKQGHELMMSSHTLVTDLDTHKRMLDMNLPDTFTLDDFYTP